MNGSALDPSDATAIELCLEEASRFVDTFCNRHFFTKTEARVFDGRGRSQTTDGLLNWSTQQLVTGAFSALHIPDCLSVTAAQLDPNSDRTWPVTLAAGTDYYLLNAFGDNQDAPPFDTFQLDIYNTKAGYTVFPSRARILRLAGTWGYPSDTVTETVTATLADASTTAMTSPAQGGLTRGQTILVDSEQLYVARGGPTAWTVQRAQNGTTGAAHAAAAITRYAYEPRVREAALIQAGRMWERRKTLFATSIVNTNTGMISVYKGLDDDVAISLAPLKRRFV